MLVHSSTAAAFSIVLSVAVSACYSVTWRSSRRWCGRSGAARLCPPPVPHPGGSAGLRSARCGGPGHAPVMSWASGAGRVQEAVAYVVAGGGVDDGPVGGRCGAVRGELGLVVDGGERVDAEVGVDRGQAQGDVAHVGGGAVHPRAGAGAGEWAAEIASIGQEQVEQLFVVAELRVTRAFRLDCQLAAGGQRAGLE